MCIIKFITTKKQINKQRRLLIKLSSEFLKSYACLHFFKINIKTDSDFIIDHGHPRRTKIQS